MIMVFFATTVFCPTKTFAEKKEEKKATAKTEQVKAVKKETTKPVEKAASKPAEKALAKPVVKPAVKTDKITETKPSPRALQF